MRREEEERRIRVGLASCAGKTERHKRPTSQVIVTETEAENWIKPSLHRRGLYLNATTTALLSNLFLTDYYWYSLWSKETSQVILTAHLACGGGKGGWWSYIVCCTADEVSSNNSRVGFISVCYVVVDSALAVRSSVHTIILVKCCGAVVCKLHRTTSIGWNCWSGRSSWKIDLKSSPFETESK